MKTSFLETIKILDGSVFNIQYHQKRYESVLSSFGLKDFAHLLTLIKAPPTGLYRCRLVYDLDANITISYFAYKKRNIKSLKIIYDDSIEYSKKYEDRQDINKLFEKREQSDDILIVKDGYIADTSIANIAFFNGVAWLTPKKPLLKGTSRQRLLENEEIIEADIKVQDLKSFSKVALLNAMIDFDIITNINYKY
ncbi:MAG: aminotransferase class IV family protein [Sulfurimonas sp.]|nr:aminotransferase class IV family protein [Sulfurimonas sp.]MDQ7061207.1 aminotransferase class IV family protein [Sulfurimonas sp.]